MKKLLLILLCVPLIGLGQVSICDSVFVSFNQIDTTTSPYLIHFDVQTFGFGNGTSFGYCGFVLLDTSSDTVAFENFNTAANVFGLMQYHTESRVLDVIPNFTLPFNGTLHWLHSWFAGNPYTACIFPFNISIGTTDINKIDKDKDIFKITNILGREAKEKNQPLFYIYDDGTVEKRIVIE